MKEIQIFLDHIGIATRSLDENSSFWKLIGLVQSDEDEINHEQGVNIRFFSTGDNASNSVSPRIELLEPHGPDTPIGRFIHKRGPGIQQICFRVDDLESMIHHLVSNGIKMINETPKKGAGDCLIAFVHPSSTGGVLVELSQFDSSQ